MLLLIFDKSNLFMAFEALILKVLISALQAAICFFVLCGYHRHHLNLILPSQIEKISRMKRRLVVLKSSTAALLPSQLVEQANAQLQRILAEQKTGKKSQSDPHDI